MSVYVPKKRARLSLQRGVRLAKAADLKRIEASVVNSQEFRFGGGVYWDGFRAVALTHRTIQRLVKERRALLSGEAVAFVKKGEEGREPFRQVCFVCGSPKGMANLIEHVLARGGKRFLERYLCAPQGSRVVAAAKEAGLERWSSYILFQRTSPNG